MGNGLLIISCVSSIAGSSYLALFGGTLDWVLLVINALPLALTANFLHILIPGLLSLILIRCQFYQKLASLFDITKAHRAEAGAPILFKCRTTHWRTFTEKGAIEHSYFRMVIPVGPECWEGGIPTAKRPTEKECGGGSAWLEARAEDHLHRGGGELGLRGKLEAYLAFKDIDPAKYPYAYLITAPRFFRYSPYSASLWYLYDDDMALSAVVVEASNTFGERRMHFVPGDEPRKKLSHSASAPELGDGCDAKQHSNVRYNFQESVSKESHTSTSRSLDSQEGPCFVETNDPLGPGLKGLRHLDVSVTLLSSKGHPKDVIQLFSLGSPIDPENMKPLERLGLVFSLAGGGLLMALRIIKEAGAYWLHGLHIWLGPEPPRGGIDRRATTSETLLESVFREYLQYLVDQSTKSLVVKYVPGGTGWNPEVMRSPRAKNGETAGELEFRVLTPAFYTRFAHYAHDFEAIFAELRESSTISVSNPELLPDLLLKRPPPAVSTRSLADYLYFRAIRWLRRRPPPLRPRDALGSQGATRAVDIRELRLSSMDGYVLAEAATEVRAGYRAVVARVLLASLLGAVSPEALWAGGAMARVAAVWLLVVSAQTVLNRLSAF